MSVEVTTQCRRTNLSLKEFVRRFTCPTPPAELCGVCPNFGRRWGCPPLSEGELSCLRQYDHIEVWAVQIFPQQKRQPLGAAFDIINAQREVVEPQLLQLEAQRGGRAAFFTGMCRHCPERQCARIYGQPCRHPQLVRPSLEALGFDLQKVARELFDIELQWGRQGRLPEYLTILGGLFY